MVSSQQVIIGQKRNPILRTTPQWWSNKTLNLTPDLTQTWQTRQNTTMVPRLTKYHQENRYTRKAKNTTDKHLPLQHPNPPSATPQTNTMDSNKRAKSGHHNKETKTIRPRYNYSQPHAPRKRYITTPQMQMMPFQWSTAKEQISRSTTMYLKTITSKGNHHNS